MNNTLTPKEELLQKLQQQHEEYIAAQREWTARTTPGAGSRRREMRECAAAVARSIAIVRIYLDKL